MHLSLCAAPALSTPRAQRILLQTPVPDADPKAVASAVLAVRGNFPVTIGDIATVKFGAALKSGDALIQGRPGHSSVAGKPVRWRQHA